MTNCINYLYPKDENLYWSCVIGALSVPINEQLPELDLEATHSSGYLMTPSRNLKTCKDISTTVE